MGLGLTNLSFKYNIGGRDSKSHPLVEGRCLNHIERYLVAKTSINYKRQKIKHKKYKHMLSLDLRSIYRNLNIIKNSILDSIN